MGELFRELRADEIEVRLGSVDRYGFTLLLYKDARCDQRILDETFGPFNWQKETRKEEGTFISRVYIKNGDDWPYKEGAGSAGNFEPEKSAESDSFKRACFAWGLGRSLYTAPRIHLKTQTEPGKNNRYYLVNAGDAYGWRVSKIDYDDQGISMLELEKDGNIEYRWEKDQYDQTRQEPITESQVKTITELLTPEVLGQTLQRFGISTVEAMTRAQFAQIVREQNA